MKAKVLAVAKETSTREWNGKTMVGREIFLGYAREGFDGYAPKVRAGIGKNSGKPYGMASESVDVAAFGNYVPHAGDIVNVEYNEYGRIVGIVKSN